MMPVGDILSTVGDVQYLGRYHDACGGYLKYRGGFSIPRGYYDARGGYQEYRVGVKYLGDTILCNLSTVGGGGVIMIHVWGYHEYCGGVQYRRGTQITRFFFHGTEHPHSTHDIPHVHHDVPHGAEYPLRYS